jgi:hypothetical protein
MRALVGPNGYMGLLLSAGYSHWGLGGGNFTSPAGQGLDVILNQFDAPLGYNDRLWQIAARMLGPAYSEVVARQLGKPLLGPDGKPNDPNPPWYLASGTPRGPFFAVGFEYDEYNWVRGQLTASTVAAHRKDLKSIGYAFVG